jgi:hypothetical protein
MREEVNIKRERGINMQIKRKIGIFGVGAEVRANNICSRGVGYVMSRILSLN